LDGVEEFAEFLFLEYRFVSSVYLVNIGLFKKITPFLDSLPMMFGNNLKRRIETRCVDYCFGGYSVVIYELDKKIGSRQKVNFSQKIKNFRHPIFLPSLRIHIQ
jgi:hypothetical protein